MTKEDLISRACKAAESGLFVFPVQVSPDPENPGKYLKKALGRSWKEEASDDPDVVEQMPWNDATHYGISCEPSKLWVVDIDDMSALARVPLPITRIQSTIRGGLHYIYKANPKLDQRNGTGVPVDGVDIRANGGYFVWYNLGAMRDDDVQPWPFKELVVKTRGTRSAGPSFIPGPVKEGGRNHDAISAAGYFMSRFPNATVDFVINQLVGHSTMNHHPPLTVDELRKVAASAMRWRKVGNTSATAEYFGRISGMPPVEPPRQICGKWLRAGTLTSLFGRAGNGKTVWMAELAYACRYGLNFMSMQCYETPRILWVNGDLPSWQVFERLGYLDEVVDIWHLAYEDLMLRQEDVIERCKGYDLVFFDNRPALFDLDDSNSSEAWKPLMNLMRMVCDDGTAVILATHAGKGEDNSSSFGSSAQEWRLDNNIHISARVPNTSDETKYMEQCDGKLPTNKIEWHKNRMSSRPQSREFYIDEVPGPSGTVFTRLAMKWECFYDASGKPKVKPYVGKGQK